MQVASDEESNKDGKMAINDKVKRTCGLAGAGSCQFLANISLFLKKMMIFIKEI